MHIRFGAIVLIVLQFAAALGFLIATAILTHTTKGEVLKGSALAALFALEEECRVVAGGLESLAGMRRKARVLHVRLRGDGICLAGETAERVGGERERERETEGDKGPHVRKKEEMY